MISLLDTDDHWVTDWWVVFRSLPAESKKSPLWKLLKPGFEHVEVWRFDRGIWLRCEPAFEFIEASAHEAPPWLMIDPALKPTVVRRQQKIKKGNFREPFFIGPWTCVELAKAFIGIRAPFIRTPWQLYKRLKK